MTNSNETSTNYLMIPSLLLSGLISFMLCSSGVFSLLSPLPIIHAGIRHGKVKAYIIALMTFGVSLYLSQGGLTGMVFAGILGAALIIGLICLEIIERNLAPFKSMVIAGVILIGIVLSAAFGYLSSVDKTPRGFFTEKVVENEEFLVTRIALVYGKDTLESKAFIQKVKNEPESFAKEIMPMIPKVFIVLIFLAIWMNLCLGFKTRFLESSKRDNIKSLIHVKVPDHFVWGFILGLAAFVFGDYLDPSVFEFGSYLLVILSIFYFFQGFGVYVSFLDNLKIQGFFRSLLVVSTVYLAFQILIILGFSDMFVNYRRFFKNNPEGEL